MTGRASFPRRLKCHIPRSVCGVLQGFLGRRPVLLVWSHHIHDVAVLPSGADDLPPVDVSRALAAGQRQQQKQTDNRVRQEPYPDKRTHGEFEYAGGVTFRNWGLEVGKLITRRR